MKSQNQSEAFFHAESDTDSGRLLIFHYNSLHTEQFSLLFWLFADFFQNHFFQNIYFRNVNIIRVSNGLDID